MTTAISETDTRVAYIDPILNKLGYDLSESIKQNFVRLEHKNRDYVVFPYGETGNAPLIVIEAKKFSIEIKLKDGFPDISDRKTAEIINQSFGYAENAGIPWILISNGRQWILMKSYIPGVLRHKRVFLAFESENDLNNRWLEFESFVGLNQELDIPSRFRKLESQLADKVMSFMLPEKTADTIALTLKDIYKKLYENAIVPNQKALESALKHLKMSEKEFKHRNCMKILHKLLFINIIESFHIQKNILSSWGMNNFQRLGFRRPILRLVNDVLADFNEKFDGDLFAEDAYLNIYYWEDELLKTAILELDKIDYSMINRDVFGDIYEHFLGEIVKEEENEDIRKILGQYYTPGYVVDYIVKNTVEPLVNKHKGDLRQLKILDPACGSGSFLIKCYEIFRKAYEKKNKEQKQVQTKKKGLEQFIAEYDPINDPLKHNLFGVDINPDAIQLAVLNLNLQKMINNKHLEYVSPYSIHKDDRLFPLSNLKVGNSLIKDPKIAGEKAFDWESVFPEVVVGERSGFDVVIGNPPYVNVEHLTDPEREYLYQNYDVCIKRVDIFIPFIDKALSLLREGGKLSYIISYAFLSQDFGEKMRKKMLDSTLIDEIIDLRKFKIFPEAMVRNIIFSITKLGSKKEEMAHSNNIRIAIQREHPKISNKIGDGTKYRTRQSIYLETPNYMFRTELNDETLSLVKKIETKSLELGNILCVSWGARGIPVNKFQLDNPISGYEHLCKKMIKGENIDRYRLNYTGKWLLYDLNGEYYPNGLYRPAFREIFENPKIVVAEVTGSKGLVATLDNDNYYTDHSLSCAIQKFWLDGKDKGFLGKHKISISENDIKLSKTYNLKYLLGLLNSSALNFYFQTLLGYELNVYPELIEKLPIPIADEDNQKPIIDKAEMMLELNRCEVLIENAFVDLLKKFGFTTSKPLSYFYPNHPVEVGIDVVTSKNFDEPEILPKVCLLLEGNFIIIADESNQPIYKIYFEDQKFQQFFFMAIKLFLMNTKKKKFNQATRIIEIPVFSNNKAINAQKIQNLMVALQSWHQKTLQEDFKSCPIQVLDLMEFEKLKIHVEDSINKDVFKLLNLSKDEIELIERIKDP